MNKAAVVIQVQSHVQPERINLVLGMRIPDEAVLVPELARYVMRGRLAAAQAVVLRLVQQVVRVQRLLVDLDRFHVLKVRDAGPLQGLVVQAQRLPRVRHPVVVL